MSRDRTRSPKPRAGDQAHPDHPTGGRHDAAVALLEATLEPVVEDMGYELVMLEWLGSGKRRTMRIYLDSPAGVSIEDCTKMARVIGAHLDASEAAAKGEDAVPDLDPDRSRPGRDPMLAAILARPYTLEVSSPGLDRPLAKRRHFEAQVGGHVKLKTHAPLQPDSDERNFSGRIVAVEADPAAPEDQGRGTVVLHDREGDRTLDIPIPRIRRANLVWEG